MWRSIAPRPLPHSDSENTGSLMYSVARDLCSDLDATPGWDHSFSKKFKINVHRKLFWLGSHCPSFVDEQISCIAVN